MDEIQRYISGKIAERKRQGNYRSLKVATGKIDFTSNNYLGITGDEDFQEYVHGEIERNHLTIGSTGSRLLSGNSAYAEQVEKQIAGFHRAEAALIFNSGFDANYGLLSCLPYTGDTVIYDEFIHASVHDGLKAGRAASVPFKHKDISDLALKLRQAKGLKYVVTESLFSMDGDIAPLKEIAELCKEYGAGLIVDEAHATGLMGNKGEGLINELGLQDDCLARIHTFGKALGVHGAAFLCSDALRNFLINYCRPFIFSTALSQHAFAAIKCSYSYFPILDDRREKLERLVQIFKEQILPDEGMLLLPCNGPIQSLIIPGNEEVKKAAQKLQEEGFDIRPVLSPTVAEDSERLRICLHSFNTEKEVSDLCLAINSLSSKVN